VVESKVNRSLSRPDALLASAATDVHRAWVKPPSHPIGMLTPTPIQSHGSIQAACLWACKDSIIASSRVFSNSSL
jgi:hypothetical protein